MLARKYYKDRMEELKSLLLEEETQFTTLVTEINEIRAGAWDDRIAAELSGAMQLQRMFSAAWSSATVMVKLTIAPLEAA